MPERAEKGMYMQETDILPLIRIGKRAKTIKAFDLLFVIFAALLVRRLSGAGWYDPAVHWVTKDFGGRRPEEVNNDVVALSRLRERIAIPARFLRPSLALCALKAGHSRMNERACNSKEDKLNFQSKPHPLTKNEKHLWRRLFALVPPQECEEAVKTAYEQAPYVPNAREVEK